MKKILNSLIIVLSIILLTGCGATNHKENVVKKYKDYFDYSLGNYRYSYEETDDNGGGSGGLSWNNYRTYYITFTYEGKEKTIEINNYYDDFNKEIIKASTSIVKKELTKITEQHESKDIKDITMYYDQYISLERIDESKNLYDVNTGVNLKELTLNNLEENNLRLKLKIDLILSLPLSEMPNLNDMILDSVKYLYEEYNLKNTIVTVNIRPKEADAIKKIDITYDGVNYIIK